ncbi:MAG: hypothetical protein IH591_08040 [Bacteroidales bacterium]|nr:hypothetical protein [Bacteroidales bacterium]
MKKSLLILIAIIAVAQAAHCQDPGFEYYQDKNIKTLMGRNRQGGGYLGMTMGYSVIDNKHAVLFGGRLSWIANQSLGIGIGGTGFINEYHYEPALDREVFLAGGYGGIYLEPILLPRSPVHLSFPVLFGAGGISYISDDESFNGNLIEESEPFLIIEPSAEIELNMSRFFRLAFGASYRFPTGFRLGTGGSEFVSASSLKGWSYLMTFKIGKF